MNPVTYKVNFADCYVLTNERTKVFIASFLNAFLPNPAEATRQYGIPQFSDHPERIFNGAYELINYLEQHPTEPHAIYWLNQELSELRGAMCIFTSDGQIILGLYCETQRPDTSIETAYLKQLLAFCKSEQGLILYEEPAPQDTPEFMQRLQQYAR